MMLFEQIKDGQQVIGSDAVHVGMVDDLTGQQLMLKQTHELDAGLAVAAEGETIRAIVPAGEAELRSSGSIE